jgi:hypothetical protein
MTAQPIKIGDRAFPTKGKAQKACQDILNGYPLGATVSDPEHHGFLEDLMLHHPESETKIGIGILWFEVRRNPKYPSQRGLFLIRHDGTETDFSYISCLTPPTHRTDVLSALRSAISEQVMTVARDAFASGQPVSCPITGELMLSTADAHVDHSDPTFLQLASDFAASEGGWDAIVLRSADGLIGMSLTDLDQLDRWVHRHYQLANLRVVSRIANLSLLRRAAP